MKRVELWCVQEDLLVADVEVTRDLGARDIRQGLRRPDTKRVPPAKKIQDGVPLSCLACTCPLIFFAGGTKRLRFKREDVEIVSTTAGKLVPECYLFEGAPDRDPHSMVGTWVRRRVERTPERANVTVERIYGVVVEDSEDSVVMETRITFAAVPGLGRIA